MKTQLKNPEMQKIFKNQSTIYKINILFLLVLILALVLSILGFYFDWLKHFSVDFKIEWTWLIIPSIVLVLLITKLAFVLIEYSSLKKTLKQYANDSDIEKSVPAFIIRLYKRISLKDIRHLWLTIFIVFYVGLFTLAFWLLQDTVWLSGHINFKLMISKMFYNPNQAAIIFTVSLVGLILVYIVFKILRQKRLTDLETVFGGELSSNVSIIEVKKNKNRLFLKSFLLSIAIILVIPIIILFIIKKIIKK